MPSRIAKSFIYLGISFLPSIGPNRQVLRPVRASLSHCLSISGFGKKENRDAVVSGFPETNLIRSNDARGGPQRGFLPICRVFSRCQVPVKDREDGPDAERGAPSRLSVSHRRPACHTSLSSTRSRVLPSSRPWSHRPPASSRSETKERLRSCGETPVTPAIFARFSMRRYTASSVIP